MQQRLVWASTALMAAAVFLIPSFRFLLFAGGINHMHGSPRGAGGTLQRGVEASEHTSSLQATQATDPWQPIPFNETDWQRDGAPTYRIEDGVLVFDSDGRGRLMSRRTYSDFELQVEFRLSAGANNGIAIRNIFIRPL
jgi:hypothetical protein